MLSDYVKGKITDMDAMQRRLKQAAVDAGLPYNGIHTIYNTRLAQELSAWAETFPAGSAFHERVFAANFVDGKNISDTEVLEALSISAGLDGQAAADVLKKRSFMDVVDRDWSAARERVVSVAPTLMLGHDRLVGARPYEAMARLMEKYGVKKRAGIA